MEIKQVCRICGCTDEKSCGGCHWVKFDLCSECVDIPEYNFAQLHLLIHALESLDVSEYDKQYIETHRLLLERFRKLIKEI